MEKNKIDLSIIIPLYNAEKYIYETLESVINNIQKYNYEIIVVNDNSTDDSINIIESMNISNLKIINNIENMGVSFSRNIGIKNSVGKYITFLDSDDTITNFIRKFSSNNSNKWNTFIKCLCNCYKIFRFLTCRTTD